MARLSSIALIIAVNILMCVFAEEELYSDEFDNIDVKAITNKAVQDEYYNCFMEIAPCKTPRQKFFTGIFSEAYQTKCKKCTEKQKVILAEVAEWYQKNIPERWEKLITKTTENMKKKAAGTETADNIDGHSHIISKFPRLINM